MKTATILIGAAVAGAGFLAWRRFGPTAVPGLPSTPSSVGIKELLDPLRASSNVVIGGAPIARASAPSKSTTSRDHRPGEATSGGFIADLVAKVQSVNLKPRTIR